MSTQTELLACPFCGGEPLIRMAAAAPALWRVSCKNCDASPSGAFGEEAAIKKWNERRAPAQQTQQPIGPDTGLLAVKFDRELEDAVIVTIDSGAVIISKPDWEAAKLRAAQCAPQPSGGRELQQAIDAILMSATAEYTASKGMSRVTAWVSREYGDAIHANGMALRRPGVHLTHCYQGEYDGCCKFGEDDCPTAPPAVSSAAREAIAEIVYDAFPYDGCGPAEKPKWMPGGNSLMQDKARVTADAILSLPAAGGEASKREAELIKAEAAFETIRLVLINQLNEPVRQAFWKAVEARDAIRASLRKDG